MISKYQFSKKYLPIAKNGFSYATYSKSPAFEDDTSAQIVCASMLKEIGFTEDEANLILFGVNEFASYNGSYSLAVIARIYKQCVAWYTRPFYEVGIDKGELETYTPNKTTFLQKITRFKYSCWIAFDAKVIIGSASDEFWYGKIIFREKTDFIAFIRELSETRQFDLLGTKGCCSNASFFSDTFSALRFSNAVKRAGWTAK